MAFPMHIDIHPTIPMGPGQSARVNREVTIGWVDVAAPGRGHITVLLANFEPIVRNLFENPVQVADGPDRTRVLQPWTEESIQHQLRIGLPSQGLVGEPRKKSEVP